MGLHKTGSSAIQSFLLSSADLLDQQGWSLFSRRPDGSQSVYGNANAWINFSGRQVNFSAKVNLSLVNALKNTVGNIIVSAEELAWLSSKEDIEHFIELLSTVFSDIQVICYVRRQDKHLLSHYLQGFRYPHSNARDFYGDDLCLLPEHQQYFKSYLDYGSKLLHWENAVGSTNITVREFDRTKLIGNDAVADFLYVLGIPISDFSHQSRVTDNESVNVSQLIINQAVFSARESMWYELGRRSFTNNVLFSEGSKPQLSCAQSTSIMSHYFEPNKELKRFIPDLSESWLELKVLQDEQGGEGALITEKDFQKAITVLACYYDQLSLIEFAKIKYRRLRDKLGFRPKIR